MNKDQINQALARMPFAETLGVTPLIMGNEFTLVLPYNQSNIGNPVLPALHIYGGVNRLRHLPAHKYLNVANAFPMSGFGHGRMIMKIPSQPFTVIS